MPGEGAYAEVRIAGVGGGRYYTPPGLPGIELLDASGNRQMAIWQEAGRVSVINDDGLDIDFRFEGANNANLIHMDAGQDAISLGGANVDGAALILNNLTDRTAVTVVGNQLHIPSQTQNFDNSSGTVAVGMTSFFGTPTLTNDSATLTFTTYATVKINSGPTASTNVTIDTALALWVAAGAVRFDGTLDVTGALTITAAAAFANSVLSSHATAGIGYATGAGGTVAQGSGSGKATAATLNNVCGAVTMDGAALGADTTVTFTLTNSAVAAGDTVVVVHESVGVLGGYTFGTVAASGSVVISVHNATPGSLSEAIVLRILVIKSVSA